MGYTGFAQEKEICVLRELRVVNSWGRSLGLGNLIFILLLLNQSHCEFGVAFSLKRDLVGMWRWFN
jgi:hypothetical protein